MRMALELAARARGRTRPNPMVGAVVVRGGRVVGRGFHRRAGGPHAEVIALRQAGPAARGAALVVTLEPCDHAGRTPPCTEAIRRAGIRRVAAAMIDPNPRNRGRGLRRLRSFGIRVSTGLLKREAERLNEVFLTWMSKGRPFVTVKAAQSLNGKMAAGPGRSRWISGPAARAWVHRLRARVDAILVGVNTVLKDDPRLTVRRAKGGNPVKVVLDSRLRTPPRARLFDSKSPVLIAATRRASRRREERLRRAGAEVLRLPARNGRVDLRALLRRLARREISHLLIEGGAETIASAFSAGVVDRVAWVIAPKILEGRGARGVKDLSVRRLGEDLLVMGRLAVLAILVGLAVPSFGQEQEDGLEKVHKVQEKLRTVEAEIQRLDQDLARPSAAEIPAILPARAAGAAESAPPAGPDGKPRVPDRSELPELVSSGDLDADLVDAALLGDTDRVQLLLRRGARANASGSMGMTALMHAAQRGHAGAIRELLLAGADVNAKNSAGHTALACAAMAGQAAVLHTLVLSGADIHVRGFAGMTALLHAAENGRTEAARVLIAWGADVNQGNAFGMTPLMFAARKGHLETVKLLLEMGADVNAREKIANQTALAIAQSNGQPETAEILRRAGGAS